MERDLVLRSKAKETEKEIGKNYIFAIGINEYIDHPNLKNAVKDIKEITKLLQAKYTFEEELTTIILDGEATRSKIISTFQKLRRQITTNDTLLILFSGHGYSNEKDKGFWVPNDASKDAEHTFISNTEIIDQIQQIDSQHTLLISDSCFSGSLLTSTRSVVADKLKALKSRWVIASGRHDQVVSDGFVNSPFAEYLIAFLSTNIEKKITINFLFENIKTCVGSNSDQLPIGGPIHKAGDQGGEYIFELKIDENSALEKAVQTNSIEALRIYIQDYPNSPFLNEVENRIELLQNEKESWSNFLETSMKQLEVFINGFNNGKFSSQAQHQKEQLLEFYSSLKKEELDEQLWESALKTNTIEAYEVYLKNNSDSKYKSEAAIRLNKLLKKKDDENCWLDTLEKMKHEKPEKKKWGYTYYLSKYPHGNFADHAKRVLNEINEFLEASDTRDIERLKQYLNSYTKGEFRYRATKLINELEVENEFNNLKLSNSFEKITEFINTCTIDSIKERAVEYKKELQKPDEIAFQKAISTNSKESLQEYLDKYPNGIYIQSIGERMSEIEMKAVEIAVGIGTKESLGSFLIDFPISEKYNYVKGKLEELDEQDFLKAKEIGSIDAYERYVFNFPNGIYLNDALHLIEKLQLENEKKLLKTEVEIEDQPKVSEKSKNNHIITNELKEPASTSTDTNESLIDFKPLNLIELPTDEYSLENFNSEELSILSESNAKEPQPIQSDIPDKLILNSIKSINEFESFKNALKSNSLKVCKQYLMQYPNSEYKTEIQNLANELAEREKKRFFVTVIILIFLLVSINLLLIFI